ncbi:uncharacterized protein RCO7_15122 [Rhynchosporium graminicola]|uniref:Uncharacterized protein n=1 Tax=Rhynchosporium graminicola TaxID=2792576 RepID=A0A1E1LL33_9HELO|nr:uncharacterized protein RCO7_15122 [Rhynchosporium commune]
MKKGLLAGWFDKRTTGKKTSNNTNILQGVSVYVITDEVRLQVLASPPAGIYLLTYVGGGGGRETAGGYSITTQLSQIKYTHKPYSLSVEIEN